MFQAEREELEKLLRQENARHVGGSVKNLWESRSQGFRDGSQSMRAGARTWLLLQVNVEP